MSDNIPYSAGTRIGRYVLIEKLGEGGMGSVWKARQSEPIERDVAIKFIKPGMDTAAVLERFAAERQSLASLDHSNIAAIFDAGSTEAGLPYYVMELVDGVPITDYCQKNTLPEKERLALFSQVCRAVQYAHDKGIVHLDLKPSNILVDDGRMKLIDFGIAKSIGNDFTQHSLCTAEGELVGTPGYMSPEQIESRRDIDGRADVYSLGALLYELLTGSPPFDKKSLESAGMLEVMRIIREEEPPRPKSDGGLDWIAMKALSKDPTQRYDSPTALAADIERHRTNLPVLAGPPSLGSRITKTIRSHRAACLVAAVVGVAGCCAFLLAKLNPQSLPTEFLVTSLADSGPGSLRQMIADAPSGATIRFAPDLKGGTIPHRGEALTIGRSLTIDAMDTGIVIDGGGESALFLISEPTAKVTISGLKLTGAGNKALHNDGAVVRVNHCIIERNKCGRGGIIIANWEGGHLTLEACLITDNEGIGVYSHLGCELTMIGCTLANNQANTAAVNLNFKARMVNCTVTGNVSVPPDFVPSPPGDYPYREGGAIAVRAYAKLTLEHCTIVGNSSPSGGGIHLWMAAEMTVKNTVIAGNISTVSGPPDISAVQGGSSVYSQGGFFLGNEDRTERILEPARYNRIPKHIVDRLYQDQIGTKDAPLDPMLAPLGDYGGPVPTMPPLPGSPLIDAVNTKNAPQATDARGVRRPIGKLYDIGAVEYDPEHDAESTKN